MRRLWALYWIAAIMMLGGLIGMGVMGARALGAAARCQCPSESTWRDLDELEARMLHAAELTRRWEYLAERHREAAPVACEQLADAATRREVR